MENNEAVNDETLNTSTEDTTVENKSDKYSWLSEEEKKILENDKIKEQKEKTKAYYETLREERDSYKDLYQKELEEKKQLESKVEYDIACAQFWEAVVSNEKVKEYKEKHPWLSYEECIKLAWVVQEKKTHTSSLVWRPARSSNSSMLIYNIEDLWKMKQSERLDILRRAKNWEVKVV